MEAHLPVGEVIAHMVGLRALPVGDEVAPADRH
jgi:hypothetical protein